MPAARTLARKTTTRFAIPTRRISKYGPLDFDVRNRFVTSFIYQLPFGQGQRFAGGSSSLVDHVIGHWTASGLVTLSSGTWYTVTDGNGNFANSDGQQRPDFVPGQKATSKPCVPGTFFNTCAFKNPPLGSFGDVSLNSLQGPGNKNVDFALEKIISICANRCSSNFGLNPSMRSTIQISSLPPRGRKTRTMPRFSEHPALALSLLPRRREKIQFAAKLHY